MRSICLPLADLQGEALADAWRRYGRTADHPDWFTRWMLMRTLAVLEQGGDAALAAAIAMLRAALLRPPLVPPVPVDARVDMLQLSLPEELALGVAERFANNPGMSGLPSLSDVPLDALQAVRKNPWGGFREAWLAHYNQRIGNTKGDGEMADTQVQSEVAGSVWKVHVQAGDTVSRDQELMILESMKMEIPVEAPCDGTVVSILVAPEEGVEEDQVLLIISS